MQTRAIQRFRCFLLADLGSLMQYQWDSIISDCEEGVRHCQFETEIKMVAWAQLPLATAAIALHSKKEAADKLRLACAMFDTTTD